MLFLFLFTSLLEVIGIGLVGPFIALATQPSSATNNPWLNLIYVNLSLSSENQLLILIGLGVVFIFYVKSFLNFISQKTIFKFGFTLQGELASRLMRAYLRAPYTFHLDRNSATLIQNIINESNRFANGLIMPLLTSISSSIIAIALVTLLVKTNATASIIILIILLVAFITLQLFKDRFNRWGKDLSEANIGIIRQINHGLGGFKETRIIGCESYFESELEKHVRSYGKAAALATAFSNFPRYVLEAFLITFLIIFTFLFILQSSGDSQDLSSILGIFALASIRLLPLSTNMLSAIATIKSNIHALNQIYFDLKDLEKIHKLASSNPLLCDPLNSLEVYRKAFSLDSRITLEQICYSYPNTSRNALRGISLEIQKGQSIGLIGKSGAGKTSLVDVILGLLIPQSGDIKVDGVSVYSDLRAWQNIIGYVPQSIFLIDDTLERNIAFGVPDHLIDQQRLYNAIHASQLTELVELLPDGIHTKLGERGVLLSGGQRQRVGIARALYHEREILVFDEATAALDNETERLVTDAIKSLSGIKTMIIIAHRLTTIEHCDCIYMLDEGRIIKEGGYQEVVLRD
jgi:ABC-type multidrug transport system fused ATPase/permease subunit